MLKDKRPFGPFIDRDTFLSQSSGEAKIRAKFMYTTKQGSDEVKQSLERRVEQQVSREVPVSNVTVMTGSGDFVMEVDMDIDKKTLTDDDEHKIQQAVGRALLNSGVEDPTADGYEYTPVIR